MKVLFVVTELQKPVGGLHRFTTELLPAWRRAFEEGKTEFEPLVISLKDPLSPQGDLKQSDAFKMPEGAVLYEAKRGGETCYFIESSLAPETRGELQKELWEDYGIKSLKQAGDQFYQNLNAFWHYLRKAYPAIREKHEIALSDCQDWLAFPAGYLLKKQFGLPLYCRIHSGEWGRSIGSPDLESAQLTIETAALQEADYLQSVSIGEARFEIFKLLPEKEELRKSLAKKKGPEWAGEQEKKELEYNDFLLMEQRAKMKLVGRRCAGVPNGIILDDWRKVTREDAIEGRRALESILPDKKGYALFIGRPHRIKGVYALLDAFTELNDDYGLVIASSFTPEKLNEFNSIIQKKGLQGRIALRNGWIDEAHKKQLFCAADVIALPSLYEPFGIVTLEGLAADLACYSNKINGPIVVVGDTGGMTETIENGINGLKVPMEEDKLEIQPAFLADALKKAFQDGEFREKITENAAKRVQNPNYDWLNIAATYGELYSLCLKNNANSKQNAALE